MHPNTTEANKSLVSNGVDRGIRCEKFRHDYMAWSFPLIAPAQPILHQVHAVTKWSQMHPNTTKRNKRWVWGPMGWIGCVHCENIWRDIVARTFALIAPVQPILHLVSCSNEILPNTHKHYATHTNMSLGSNGVDWVRSFWKILMRLQGTNFYINCTSSTHFAPSFV